jgi:hypothetical protein
MATRISHARSRSGSRIDPSFRHAIDQAVCTASSAMAASRVTYAQTRRMSS